MCECVRYCYHLINPHFKDIKQVESYTLSLLTVLQFPLYGNSFGDTLSHKNTQMLLNVAPRGGRWIIRTYPTLDGVG